MIKNIVLAGRSLELWTVAALLTKGLPEPVQLTLVEEDHADHPVAITLPFQCAFHNQLGVSGSQFVERCNAMIRLGTEYAGWHGEKPFVAAASGNLPMVEGTAIHQVMLRAAMMQGEPEKLSYLYQPFRFAARAASEGKFSLPDDNPLGPTAMLGPTVQVSGRDYAQFLGQLVPETISMHQGRPCKVEQAPDTGAIRSVSLEDGAEIVADLFIDLSGCLSGLVDQRLATKKQQFGDIMPFDCIASFEASNGGNRIGRIRAEAAGFAVETPLRDTIVTERLLVSHLVDDEDPAHGDARAFEACLCERPWTGNLVRLGPASGRLGPAWSADMRLLHEQALMMVAHLPVGPAMEAEAAAFNDMQHGLAEEIRDFVLLPLALNGIGAPFWRAIANADRPDSLQLRIDQFRSRGRFVPYEHEVFDTQLWIEMLINLGIVPDRFDIKTASLDMGKIAPVLKKLAGDFDKALRLMPDQADYLRKIKGS